MVLNGFERARKTMSGGGPFLGGGYIHEGLLDRCEDSHFPMTILGAECHKHNGMSSECESMPEDVFLHKPSICITHIRLPLRACHWPRCTWPAITLLFWTLLIPSLYVTERKPKWSFVEAPKNTPICLTIKSFWMGNDHWLFMRIYFVVWWLMNYFSCHDLNNTKSVVGV